MKNRFENEMDPELQRQIEGLTETQIAVMADIFLGLAEHLTENPIAGTHLFAPLDKDVNN